MNNSTLLTPSELVRFEIGDETLLVGTQNDGFVDEATRLLEAGEKWLATVVTIVDPP